MIRNARMMGGKVSNIGEMCSTTAYATVKKEQTRGPEDTRWERDGLYLRFKTRL